MDLRIEHIFQEEMKGDTSFQEKPTILEMLFGSYNPKHNAELKETWNSGIKLGIEIGLYRTELDGQIIELNKNTTNEKHKEFLQKFYELANEYNCAIQYHPIYGMTTITRDKI